MKLIYINTILFFSFIVSLYADQNIFYDKITGKQIVDVSGKKTKTQIAVEFNITEENLQEITIKESIEGVTIVNGVLIKTDLIAERLANENKMKLDKKAKHKPAMDKLKALGWTEIEINALLQ